MSPARQRLSDAVRKLAPGGIVTLTGAPGVLLSHAPRSATEQAMRSARQLSRRTLLRTQLERMLQQNRRGERVDIALSPARRAAHLAHRAQRRCRRIPLVDESHRKSRALLELGGDHARLDRARRVVALIVQRQSHHERRRLGRLRAAHDLRDGRALPRAAHDEARRGRDRARRIAHREPHALLPIVDGENAPRIRRGRARLVLARARARILRVRVPDHPCAIEMKNSRFVFVRAMRCSRNSIASVLGMSLRKLRSRYTRLSSAWSSSSSSLRVPERPMSIAGNTRRSAILRSSTSSMFPVPLNSSKITSSMREPVSTSAVAMIVSEPPSSMLRAAPKKCLGLCSACASTPPERIFPECGTMTLCARASRVMESSRITTSRPCSTRRFAFSITMSATCTCRSAGSSNVELITSALFTCSCMSVTSSGPVSYTHLRAPATDSYLV